MRNRIVTRKVYPVVPPRAEYSLIPLGETLILVIGALGWWAEAHLGEVKPIEGAFRILDSAEEKALTRLC